MRRSLKRRERGGAWKGRGFVSRINKLHSLQVCLCVGWLIDGIQLLVFASKLCRILFEKCISEIGEDYIYGKIGMLFPMQTVKIILKNIASFSIINNTPGSYQLFFR